MKETAKAIFRLRFEEERKGFSIIYKYTYDRPIEEYCECDDNFELPSLI